MARKETDRPQPLDPETWSVLTEELIPQMPPEAAADAPTRAREILRRLAKEDPHWLDLRARCARFALSRAFLVDPDRFYQRALAFVAYAAARDGDTTWRNEWLDEQLAKAIQSILTEDEEADAAGKIAPDPWDSPHAFLMQWLGIEGGLAQTAAVRFNGLPDLARRVFFALIVERKTLEDCHDLGPRTRIQTLLDASLRALFHTEDPGRVEGENPR